MSAALRGRVSLPRAWWTDSLILWAIALGALLVPSRARRLLRGRDRWREGTLDDRRRASLEDGTTFELPYGTNLAPGPIVVFTAGAARAGEAPFRASPVTEVPPRDAIAQGTGQSVSDGLEAELDGRLAYVSAIAMTAAAPWIAALATGLAP